MSEISNDFAISVKEELIRQVGNIASEFREAGGYIILNANGREKVNRIIDLVRAHDEKQRNHLTLDNGTVLGTLDCPSCHGVIPIHAGFFGTGG